VSLCLCGELLRELERAERPVVDPPAATNDKASAAAIRPRSPLAAVRTGRVSAAPVNPR